ncbi:protein walls are thin 1, partial [Phtheirospermum japonicum]
GGSSVITLYKGPTIYSPAPRLQSPTALGDAKGKNWTLGCIYLIGHCLSWSGWLVLQAPVLKTYPARLSFTSYQCFFGIIQFLVIAAFVERDPQAWLVHFGYELFSVFYAGVVASGIAFAVQIWCIDRGGPGLRGRVSACSNTRCRHYDLCSLGRGILLGRVYSSSHL